MSGLFLRYSRAAAPLSRSSFASSALRTKQRAAFSVAAVRKVGKESAVHADEHAEVAENTKQEELQKQKEGKNEFRREISSDSEEAIKADQGELEASDKNIKEMQEETKGPN